MTAPYRGKRSLTLAQRADATRAVLAVWGERPFDWRAGYHCVALMHAQARAMGHRMPKLPVIRTALAAERALHKMGVTTVEDLMTSLFPRIAPAAMRVGDICTMPGEGDDGRPWLASVCIADGHGNLFGWHGADGSRISAIKFGLVHATGAWRLGEVRDPRVAA